MGADASNNKKISMKKVTNIDSLSKIIDSKFKEIESKNGHLQRLIITTDIALATALNIRRPTGIGYYALTPKQIVRNAALETIHKPIANEKEIIKTISDNAPKLKCNNQSRTRYISTEVNNIRRVLRYKINDDNTIDNIDTEVLVAFRNIDNALENLVGDERIKSWSVFKNSNIITIEKNMFDELDKKIIPDSAEDISIFEKEFNPEMRFVRAGNDRQIAEYICDMINRGHLDDTAIVINVESPIASAIKSMFYKKEIPFIDRPKLKDLQSVKRLLNLLSLSLHFDRLRVEDVCVLFDEFRIPIKNECNNTLLSKITFHNEKREKMRVLMKEISYGHTKLSSTIPLFFGDYRKTIESIIEYYGDEEINNITLAELIFFIKNSNEIKFNEYGCIQKKGVLIVDCNNSGYIDRNIVIYAGMGHDWDPTYPSERYVDLERESEINKDRFTVLMQQGDEKTRYFITNVTKNGEEAKPALIFDEFNDSDKPIKSFDDLGETTNGLNKPIGGYITDGAPLGETPYVDYFYKTTYNEYINCPRCFVFNRLLYSEYNTRSLFGIAVHEFAEYYACYRKEIKHNKKKIKTIKDNILERHPEIEGEEIGEFTVSAFDEHTESIMLLLDKLDPDDIVLDLNVEFDYGKSKKPLFTKMDKQLHSSRCETEATKSKVNRIEGKMDLYTDGVIYDYKTGKIKTADDVFDKINDVTEKYPEFQPIFYLALSQEIENSKNEFILFYTKNAITTKGIIDPKNKQEIKIYKDGSDPLFKSAEFIKQLDFNKNVKENIDVMISGLLTYKGTVTEIATKIKQDFNRPKMALETFEKCVKLYQSELINYKDHYIINDKLYISQKYLDKIISEINDNYQIMIESSTMPVKTIDVSSRRKACDGCDYYKVCINAPNDEEVTSNDN